MKTEKSCGAVVFTRENDQIKYVIIRSVRGIYGFPKGHMEKNETEAETALREIKEETGVDVTLIDGYRMTDEYQLPRANREPIQKEVVYFLAEFQGQKLHAQPSEVASVSLMDYEDAIRLLRFESARRILRGANDFVKNMTQQRAVSRP